MKRQNLFAIACVATTAAATLVGNVGSANATALYGKFQFSNENFNPATSVTLSNSGITFSNPAQFNILGPSTTSTFTGFKAASILGGASLSTAGSSVDITNLLDLGIINGSLADAVNTFTLTDSYAFQYNQFGPPMFATTSISVGVNGFFTGNGGEQTMGSGIFTFQVVGQTIAEIQQTLASGGSFSNLTFSGGFMAEPPAVPVPEPTALAGLGLVAGLLAVSRRRKADNN